MWTLMAQYLWRERACRKWYNGDTGKMAWRDGGHGGGIQAAVTSSWRWLKHQRRRKSARHNPSTLTSKD
jgi:hypothetical protein